jgi:hypothetical protein
VLPPAAWAQRIDTAVVALASWARPDGSYDTGESWCHGQANFWSAS